MPQLSPEFSARLVDRWQKLGEQVRNPIDKLTRVELLRFALDSEEKRLELRAKVKTMQVIVEAHACIAGADGTSASPAPPRRSRCGLAQGPVPVDEGTPLNLLAPGRRRLAGIPEPHPAGRAEAQGDHGRAV